MQCSVFNPEIFKNPSERQFSPNRKSAQTGNFVEIVLILMPKHPLKI